MLEKVKADIEAALPGCHLEIVLNGSPSGQHSLLVSPACAVEVARFLRDSPDLRLDYCSNVSGVDWLDREISEKVKIKKGCRWRGTRDRRNQETPVSRTP